MKSKYLNTFDRTVDYDAYIESSFPEFPNVGYDKQEDKVKIRRESPNNHLLYGTLSNPSGAVPTLYLTKNGADVKTYTPTVDTATGEFYIDDWGTVPEFNGIVFSNQTAKQNISALYKFKGLDISNVTFMQEQFRYFSNATKIDVSSFDTSNVTSMASMFTGCQMLNSLDVSSFDTSKVTNMVAMFYDCMSLNILDLSNFDTSNVTSMYQMFNETALTSLNISSFDTSNVTAMTQMFMGSTDLTSLDVSSFNTSKVTYMDDMFHNCSALTSLDVSNFNTSNVTTMRGMFWSCSSLTSLDLSNFDVSKVTDMQFMFRSCSALTSLDLSGWDIDSSANITNMFKATNNITDVYITEQSTFDKLTHNGHSQGTSYIPSSATIHYNGTDYKWQNNAWTPQN